MNPNPLGQSWSVLLCGLFASTLGLSLAVAQPPAQDPNDAFVFTEDNADDKKGDKKETEAKASDKKKDAEKDGDKAGEKTKWTPLIGSWQQCQFGGDGPIEITDKLVKLGLGDPLTGIRWDGDVARENYEVELEARRTDGFDFFCGLTFPVGKDHVSFILGGWGGGVVGISSVDGRDASDNETTSFRNFENEKWYRVRVRVDPHEIQCWIDDKPAAEQVRQGREFDIRYEMDPCVPLGIAAFQCDAEYRNLRMRKLSDAEIAAAKKKAESTADGS